VTDRVLVDTGPLVAFLSRNDAWHDAGVAQFDLVGRPFLTCWPVLTEAAWLLRDSWPGAQALLRLCDEGVLRVEPLDGRAPAWMAGFMGRYRNLRPDLADAALAYLA
jgi:predicted nucleic acid-binding protein